MLCQKAGIGSLKIDFTLMRKELSVNPGVTRHHAQTVFKSLAVDAAVLYLDIRHKRNCVGKSPGIALALHRSKLIDHGKSLVVRRNDGDKEFAAKLPPEMIQKILGDTTEAPVVVRGGHQ